MLTEKENLLMVLAGEVPEWVPRNLVASPGHAPASTAVTPGFLNARRDKGAGFDIWGVEYVTTKETGYMALPKPGQFILDDIRKAEACGISYGGNGRKMSIMRRLWKR